MDSGALMLLRQTRHLGAATPERRVVNKLLDHIDATAEAVVEAMEHEGVVTWGDAGHRQRFLASLRGEPDTTDPIAKALRSLPEADRAAAESVRPFLEEAMRPIPLVECTCQVGGYTDYCPVHPDAL